jgi:hypothetical protein
MATAKAKARRDKGRVRHRTKPPAWLDRYEGGDETTIILSCTSCYRLFDVPRPKPGVRAHKRCEDCRDPRYV